MKTAKEMFEELGFKRLHEEKDELKGVITWTGAGEEIVFNLTWKYIETYSFDFEYYDNRPLQIELELFKAIAKQVEELGWNEEGSN